MRRLLRFLPGCCLSTAIWATGCMSPYRSDQGALVGGLTGAGVGALVGDAVHHPLAGAAIGAGVGALSGAAVGSSLDQIDARNRAEIAARLGRPAPGAVTVNDVIAMTRAGVPESVIVTHVQAHGLAAPLQSGDLIVMQQQGVSPAVVQAMQARQMQPPVVAQPVMVQPQPVYVAPYSPGYYAPPPGTYYYGGLGWGRGW